MSGMSARFLAWWNLSAIRRALLKDDAKIDKYNADVDLYNAAIDRDEGC